ncbi:MAG: transporter substrate-binding domain-containing protein, partial [Desulforhabdus sp.]|nr:transporter substrate-binding domain-containing protein [Desulforhabdus sp.]
MIVNRFNRILVRLPFFILFFFLLIASYASAEGRNVKVGVYQNAPKVHISESGQPAGIFIDIIEYIAQREGWNLYYVPGTWGEGLDRLLKGEIDLMPDVAHTADREKIYSFHQEPVLSSWFQIYARKGSGIRSILDLNGKRVIVLERTVQQEAFSRLAQSFGLSIDLASAPDYEQIFAEVAKGKADAAITNRFYGLMHAERLGLEDTAVIFNPSNLYFAAYKSGPGQVLDTIDAYLLKLKKDPQSIYYQSLKRWTSEEVHFKLPAWVQLTGLIAGIVLFMSLMGAVILKRQVNSRTRALTKRNKQMAIIDRT